jgi:DnaJ-class molecular chaperone
MEYLEYRKQIYVYKEEAFSQVNLMNNKGIDLFIHTRQLCPMCKGRGKVARWPNVFDQSCPRCHGTGEVMT